MIGFYASKKKIKKKWHNNDNLDYLNLLFCLFTSENG